MRTKSIIGFVSVVFASFLAFGIFAKGESEYVKIIPDGYIDLEDFGGYASDGKDDTQAFKDALKTGKNVYLRIGQYEVHETIEMQDQNLIGCGAFTVIVSSNKSAADPIIKMGGLSRLEGVNLTYESSCIKQDEKEGERVAVSLGCQTPIKPGSTIKEIIINWVGTGIYSPNVENAGASGLRIDSSYISKYIYRGVDFQKVGQYGNLISNLYICDYVPKVGHDADAAFAVEGEEYNLQVDQLNIEGMPVWHDLLLKNCHNAQFGSVHMEAVQYREANAGLVKVDNSTVRIDGLTAYYINSNQPNCALIELGEAQTSESNGNYFHIGTLHFKGFGSEDKGFNSSNGKTFKIVKRSSEAKGNYTFKLDKYVWYTWLGEASVYESFPCDETGITYLSKGN